EVALVTARPQILPAADQVAFAVADSLGQVSAGLVGVVDVNAVALHLDLGGAGDPVAGGRALPTAGRVAVQAHDLTLGLVPRPGRSVGVLVAAFEFDLLDEGPDVVAVGGIVVVGDAEGVAGLLLGFGRHGDQARQQGEAQQRGQGANEPSHGCTSR